jgi:hypothetical protein
MTPKQKDKACNGTRQALEEKISTSKRKKKPK